MKKAVLPLSHLFIAHSHDSDSSQAKKHLSAVKSGEGKNIFFDKKEGTEMKRESKDDPGEKDPGWYSSYE